MVSTSPQSIYEVATKMRVRITSARFTNTSQSTAFLSIFLKNANLQTVLLCPDGLNLDPGCTLELFDAGEEIWFYEQDQLYARVYNDVRVQYIVFFGNET